MRHTVPGTSVERSLTVKRKTLEVDDQRRSRSISTTARGGVQSIAISVSVDLCRSVRLSVRSHVQKAPVQTTQNSLYMLPVAVGHG